MEKKISDTDILKWYIRIGLDLYLINTFYGCLNQDLILILLLLEHSDEKFIKYFLNYTVKVKSYPNTINFAVK